MKQQVLVARATRRSDVLDSMATFDTVSAASIPFGHRRLGHSQAGVGKWTENVGPTWLRVKRKR